VRRSALSAKRPTVYDTSDATQESEPSSPPPARNIIGEIYSSRCFEYFKDRREFYSNLSETPAILRQLWDNSFDLGFGIRSAKTGKVVAFTLCFAPRDINDRYTHWVFEAKDVEPRLIAVVINDT
jgi:hypothetical protein